MYEVNDLWEFFYDDEKVTYYLLGKFGKESSLIIVAF